MSQSASFQLLARWVGWLPPGCPWCPVLCGARSPRRFRLLAPSAEMGARGAFPALRSALTGDVVFLEARGYFFPNFYGLFF